MKKLIMGIICLALLAGCTDATKARTILEAQGYTQVHITGYRPWACSEEDFFKTGFTALTPTAQRITGTVCSGLLKGATVRFD